MRRRKTNKKRRNTSRRMLNVLKKSWINMVLKYLAFVWSSALENNLIGGREREGKEKRVRGRVYIPKPKKHKYELYSLDVSWCRFKNYKSQMLTVARTLTHHGFDQYKFKPHSISFHSSFETTIN